MGMMDSLRRLAETANQKKLEAQTYIQQKTGGGYAKAQREEKFDAWLAKTRSDTDLWTFNKLRQYGGDSLTSKVVGLAGMTPRNEDIRRDPDESRAAYYDDFADYERTPREERSGMKGSK